MGAFMSTVMGSGPADGLPPEPGVSPDNVITFRSKERWDKHLEANGRNAPRPRLMVVDFSSTWCGPCRLIQPFFNEMACRYDQVEFVKIDVDELPEVAKAFHVDAMPTFVLIKGGKERTRVVGAKKDDLERNIAQYSTAHTT